MSTDGLIGSGSPVGRPAMAGKDSKNKDDSGNEAVLVTMRKQFDDCSSAEQENRDNYIRDTRMCSSADQWDEEVKKRRGNKRPAMTFNMLNLVVKQIIGDYRQNKLAIKVLPAGAQATDDVADILGGLIRNIEMDSHAEQAYTNALECAARGNIGWFRILTDYESDDVFHQKLLIKPIHNPLTVYCDPAARLITRADANFMLITEMMAKDDFARKYPKANPNGWDMDNGDSANMDGWQSAESIRIAEYYTKELVMARLVQFDSGAVVQIESDDEIDALEQIGWNPVKEREAERTNIKWRKCTGTEVLEERTYKAKYIPVIPVLGEEINIEGKPRLRSSIYYSHDAQKSYNYERSTAIERNALSAKAPWLVTQKMIEQWKEQWDNANVTPLPYLVFSPDNTLPGGVPQRIEPPAPAAAEIQGAQASSADLQRTSGVFNSQVGASSNIQSGVGLSEQQSQGATSTFIFPDNLRTGIEHCGRVLIDWIPVVYDKERVVRTVSTEDDIEMMTVNQQQVNPLLGITEVLNDITVGKYDVIVTAGKAFASRRREAVDGMMKFAQSFPQQAPLIADLMIKNMDVPGGEVMAERIKRSLPPQVVNDPDSPEGQQAQQQAQQQQASQQQTQQQLIQGKMAVEQGKNQASMAKSQADVVKSQAEVTKAKADTIQAIAQTHNTAAEHAANVLDSNRMGSDDSQMQSNAPAPQAQPAQPTPAMQQQPMQQSSPQPHIAQITIAKDPNDVAREQHRDESTELLKQGIGAIAQHLAASHEVNARNAETTHQLLAHIAHGNQALGQHLANQNAIATAPTEAIRDKAGKIIGSRKVMQSKP